MDCLFKKGCIMSSTKIIEFDYVKFPKNVSSKDGV